MTEYHQLHESSRYFDSVYASASFRNKLSTLEDRKGRLPEYFQRLVETLGLTPSAPIEIETEHEHFTQVVYFSALMILLIET